MSPTLKSITTNHALTTTSGKEVALVNAKPLTRWKRRQVGNLVSVSINAPGLVRRKRKTTDDAYYWMADETTKGQAALERGFTPKAVRLHGSPVEIKARCDELQKEVEIYVSGNRAIVNVRYTGTLGSLIKLYRASEESGYLATKYNTRRGYDYLLDVLADVHGRRHLSALTRKEFFKWHKAFIKPANGKAGYRLSLGSKLMQMLRVIIKFGIETDSNCDRLQKILQSMRFEAGANRRQYLTADHVAAFCKEANAMGHPLMALAQAIQYETALRQKDVIGEWWPEDDRSSDRNRSRIGRGLRSITTETWGSGLVWGVHINEQFLMAKPTSKSRFKKIAISDLTLCPMVMKEIQRIPADLMTGPVIVDGRTGLPYRPRSFSALWRSIADRAGIPPDHCNMDSRSGAITEGSEADIDLEHLRQFATHSEATMTQHYNRDSLVKARKVHRARAAHRAEPDQSKFDHGPIIDMERGQ